MDNTVINNIDNTTNTSNFGNNNNSENTKITLIANGYNTKFNFIIKIWDKDEITVYKNDQIVDKSQYDIRIFTLANMFSIIFNEAPEMDAKISVVRNLQFKRRCDFQPGGSIKAEDLNNEMDHQMECIKQVNDATKRAMTMAPNTDLSGIDLTMPKPEAGKSIVWSSDAKRLENSEFPINSMLTAVSWYKDKIEGYKNEMELLSSNIKLDLEKLSEIKSSCQNIFNEFKNFDFSNLITKDLSNSSLLNGGILGNISDKINHTDRTVTIKKGAIFLMPDGAHEKGGFKNIKYETFTDITGILKVSESFMEYYFGIDNHENIISGISYQASNDIPVINNKVDEAYFNTNQNMLYFHNTGQNEWQHKTGVIIIGKYRCVANKIIEVESFNPISINNCNNNISSLQGAKTAENSKFSVNLDNYKTSGVYVFNDNRILKNPDNPFGGILMVIGNSNKLIQIWHRICVSKPFKTFTRNFDGINNKWSRWE